MQRPLGKAVASAVLALAGAAWAADDDPDAALQLQSAPVAPAAAATPGQRIFVEGAVGRAWRRYDLDPVSLRRLSIDASWRWKLGDAWRMTFSDRLDYLDPATPGDRATTNSFREGYASWNDEGHATVVDLGRVNVRLGPAYGYNPTDFFRDGAVRTATTDDPFALRENRQGTVMLRGQRLWNGGSASLAFAPKLGSGRSTSTVASDFGSTNANHKAVATWSFTASDRLSGQLLAFAEESRGAQGGASATWLLSDALVGHAEWTYGRDELLLARATSPDPERATRSRAAIGATYTAPTRLALTLEFEYNGFAPSESEWNALFAANPPALARLLVDARRRQDLASRKAWLLYATQRDIGMKNLEATGFVRLNAQDDSYLAWVELRYHWPKFDVAVQWRRGSGDASSEFGLPPQRSALQLIGAWYF